MVKDLPPVTKEQARQMQEDALARFMAQGGQVEVLKGRKNPKVRTANGKNKGGGKILLHRVQQQYFLS